MRRVILVAVLLTGVAGASVASPALATGVSPAQLTAAGWTCLVPPDTIPGEVVHCAPPGQLAGLVAGTAQAVRFDVFDTTDPSATQASFLGTEMVIRADLFHGQPCPTDPPSREWTYLPDIGLPFDYYGCHRLDSPL